MHAGMFVCKLLFACALQRYVHCSMLTLPHSCLCMLQERQHAYEYTQRVETTFDVHFEEGRNERLEFMAHLWEPLRWIHKPLALYLGAELMWLASNVVLYAQGFRPHWHDVRTSSFSSVILVLITTFIWRVIRTLLEPASSACGHITEITTNSKPPTAGFCFMYSEQRLHPAAGPAVLDYAAAGGARAACSSGGGTAAGGRRGAEPEQQRVWQQLGRLVNGVALCEQLLLLWGCVAGD